MRRALTGFLWNAGQRALQPHGCWACRSAGSHSRELRKNCCKPARARHLCATELEWRLAAGSVAAPPTLERPSANRNDEKQAAGERADTHRL